MQPRMRNPALIVPEVLASLQAVGAAAMKAAPAPVMGLVHMRASQLNGCAVCLDMHLTTKYFHPETDHRVLTLAGWRESSYFTDAERAALALTESLTKLDGAGVPDAVWDEAARHFDEPTLAAIVVEIAMANLWNRLNVATKQVAGQVKWG